MGEGFTNKEMLERILNKLDVVENRINETKELAIKTNGKVKLHTKIITWLGGVLIGVIGWFISHIITVT